MIRLSRRPSPQRHKGRAVNSKTFAGSIGPHNAQGQPACPLQYIGIGGRQASKCKLLKRQLMAGRCSSAAACHHCARTTPASLAPPPCRRHHSCHACRAARRRHTQPPAAATRSRRCRLRAPLSSGLLGGRGVGGRPALLLHVVVCAPDPVVLVESDGAVHLLGLLGPALRQAQLLGQQPVAKVAWEPGAGQCGVVGDRSVGWLVSGRVCV